MYNKFIWALEHIFPIIFVTALIALLLGAALDWEQRTLFVIWLIFAVTTVPWVSNEMKKLWDIDREEKDGTREDDDRGTADLEELD